jgi:hypothetical protein
MSMTPQPVGVSHVTRRNRHVTRHTSHVTRHTSRVTRHTSSAILHMTKVTQVERHVECITSYDKSAPSYPAYQFQTLRREALQNLASTAGLSNAFVQSQAAADKHGLNVGHHD